RGFNKPNRKQWAELSIANVNRAIEAGKLDSKTDYDAAALVEAGVLRRARDGVRLIGSDKLSKPVKLTVSGATPGAIKAVEAAKGSVTILNEEVTYRGKGEKADKSGKVSKADKKSAPKAKATPKAKAAPKPKAAPKAKAAPKTAEKKTKVVEKTTESDDLTKISGIGPVFSKRLAAEGLTTYAQVAELTKERIAELDAKLDLKNNIDNDDWPGQAKALMAKK
ncbi:MAG: uL15 family ribosomal protein, partial [Litorimonas sp.]